MVIIFCPNVVYFTMLFNLVCILRNTIGYSIYCCVDSVFGLIPNAQSKLANLRFLWDEATRSISSPPGWDTSPSQVTSQHFVRLSPKQFAGSHLYTWVERGTVRVKCFA